MPNSISQTDDAVIQILLRQGPMAIADLQEELGVTATAVRQRLNRLMERGFVDRVQESKRPNGRGRPLHKYRLTKEGQQTAGDNLADLARALWSEVQSNCDVETRRKIIAGTVQRLSQQYDSVVVGQSIEERLNSTAKVLAERDIPILVEDDDGLPVLKILACPYPDVGLVGERDHDICEMEKQVFSQVLGEPVELRECRKDGDGCCTFVATVSAIAK